MIDYKNYAQRAIAMLKELNEFLYERHNAVHEGTQSVLQDWEEEHNLGEFPLPDWAEAYNHNFELVLRAQLCTKDGRRMGNARVIAINDNHPLFPNQRMYVIRTDVGSEFTYMRSEVEQQFFIGMFIMKEGQ